jgi:hypothetical protein
MAGSEGIPDSEFTDIVSPDPAALLEAEKPANGAGEGEGADTAAGAEGADTVAAADGADTLKAADGDDGEAGEKGKEGEDTAKAADGDDALRDGKGRFKGGFQARIDELTAARHNAERRAAAAEAQLAALNSSDKDAPTAEPTPDQFEDYGDYVKALTKWTAKASATDQAATDATAAHDEAANTRGQIWGARVEATKATLPDWDNVAGKSETPLREDIALAMMEAERGPELLYHLAQNPDVAAQLNDMSPARAAMELGRIEAKLEGPKAPPPKAASKAPAPIDPVKPGSSATKSLADIDDMEEYVAKRKSQGATWAR